jgi:hypothetical protein
MKFRSLYISICLSAFVFSCNKTQSQDVSKTTVEVTAKILKTDIDKITYVEYVLSRASQKTTADWQNFHELETEIEILKSGKLNFFKEDATILKTFMKNLDKSIPEALNTEDVTTRISALENATYFLFSELNLNRQDKTFSLKAIKGLLIAVSNLKLQINKKLELDAQNIVKPQ